MPDKKIILRKASIWLTVIALSFSVGFITKVSDDYFEISKNLDIFGKVYKEVNALYVDDIDPTDFMRKGMDAMLGSLDPFTNFISASEIEDFRFMSTGQYGGIGALIGKRDDRIMVMESYKDRPADKAGLKAGDVLIQVDDEPIEGTDKNTSDVRNLLRGQPNTEVRMTVRRQGTDKPIEVKLMRENIKINNVPFHGMATEDIGYIVLSGFTQDAGNEVREALQELKGKTPGLKGVILDVRGNPGGLLNEAVNVSSVFIPNGEKVVETKGRMEGSQKDYLTRLAPVDLEIPLAVVTDRRSASASEIVTGVVQDLDRGIVVGERTYGKGLVQTTRPLSYNNQIKLTTAKYYIPSGRCIQAINYAERDDEGAVKRIPDSLRNEFHTRSGRLVYDGGGIEPDIQVAPEKLKAVTVELERKGLIFDYATGFALRNAEIPAPSEFEVSEAIYTEFMDFVKTHDFTYDTKAEKELEKLKEIVEEESEFASISAPYTALSSKLKEQKKDALIAHKDEISRLLKEEIILRYYYEVGVIEASFTDDPAIKEAISVLHDPTRYNKILGR